MVGAGRHEDGLALPQPGLLALDLERTRALEHDVHLVVRVRLLAVGLRRDEDVHPDLQPGRLVHDLVPAVAGGQPLLHFPDLEAHRPNLQRVRLRSSPQRGSARSPMAPGPHDAKVRACNVPSAPFISRSASARPAPALRARSGRTAAPSSSPGARSIACGSSSTRVRTSHAGCSALRQSLEERPLGRGSGESAERGQRSPAAWPARIGFRRDARVGAAASAGAPRGRDRPHLGALTRRRARAPGRDGRRADVGPLCGARRDRPDGQRASSGSSPTASTRRPRRRSAILRTAAEFSASSSTRRIRFACTT